MPKKGGGKGELKKVLTRPTSNSRKVPKVFNSVCSVSIGGEDSEQGDQMGF
jgi:hypothetical protein